MEYFNAGGGGAGNAPDPYGVIPQQFGNGGLPPPQTAQQHFADYQQDGASDYEAYQQQQQQQQQQYRAQQPQQSPSIYYPNQMTAAQGSYFPIHSASEHDFLGPQHPPTGAPSGAAGAGGAPYQTGGGGANKEFIIQHQQRRGNQSGQQQGQQPQQSQNQQGRQQQQQNQQQPQQQQQMMSGATSNATTQHYMQMQAVQQQQAAVQQMHRIQGAPINPQQFMVPPPAILQTAQLQGAPQQQVAPQIHQMPMHPQHPQMMQQAGYHPQGQQQHQQQGGHHQGHGGHQGQHHHQPHHNQHHHQNQQHIPQHPMMARLPMLKDWPIRCVIEGKYQPVIIGLNGSVIRDIAHSTHCRVEFVNLSKRERAVLGNNDRILTVHGHAEQASKAVARILEVIQNEALKDDENVYYSGADIMLRLRAHNQLCGRLIGRLGSSIKEIMTKTGTAITVAKYIDPVGGLAGLRHEELLCLMERTIVVRGPSIEAVVQAESLISAKLKKCYESDSQLKAQAMTSSGGPLPPIPFIHGPPPGAPPNVIHPPSLIPTPTGLIQVQHFPPSHNPPTPSNSFLQPGILQIPPGAITLRHVRMWVPDTMIGALIGAKGKNIKMIIRETCANVKIEAPEEKALREAEEAERKKLREKANEEEDKAAGGDHADNFLEDSGTVTSADAIEEKPKPVPERMVTIHGDDLQLLKAESFVFSKIAETCTPIPTTPADIERTQMLRIRTEVLVPTRIIGRIIGRGGQNVRELQRITGAIVKIPVEERNGELTRHEDGFEEEMTMIRTFGNMNATHNVQFRLSNLISDYYRSGEHRQKNYSSDHHHHHHHHGGSGGGRARSAQSAGHSQSASPLNQMGQLGQVPPISTSSNRTSPQSSSSQKS